MADRDYFARALPPELRAAQVVVHDLPEGAPSLLANALADCSPTRVFHLDEVALGVPMPINSDTAERSVLHWVVASPYITEHEAQARSRMARLPWGAAVEYEFARVDDNPGHRLAVLEAHLRSDPVSEKRLADQFFGALSSAVPYTVEVATGDACNLRVRGATRWLELCGPIQPGDRRFFPGCEIFLPGNSQAEIDGTLEVGGGINVLPFRNDAPLSAPHVRVIRDLLAVSSALSRTSAIVTIEAGAVVAIEGSTALGELLDRFWNGRQPDRFRTINEVGIGVHTGGLLGIDSWPSPTNEACRGVHIGLGADPMNPDAHPVLQLLHFDLVSTNAQVRVNGHELAL